MKVDAKGGYCVLTALLYCATVFKVWLGGTVL